MNSFILRRLALALCATGMLGVSTESLAAAFQLWEQDGASVANYHAGYAVFPYNASIAFYNPAGITLFKNQQLSAGGAAIMSDFKYEGSVTVIESGLSQPFNDVTAQGGNFSFVPNVSYVAPINDKIGFGFTVNVPFGLKTDYGRDTPLQYAATLTSINVINISPSLGFKVTDKGSLGIGFDVQRAYAEFNSVATVIINSAMDSTSTNKANDTGYGYHLGALYEFTPHTQAGLSYHSQVVHHFSGTSKLEGPIADMLANGSMSSRATTNVTLPPYTALSVYHRLIPKVAFLGTIIYTQWNIFKTLTLKGISGAEDGLIASNNIVVMIPEHYRNTWNFSLGADYYATDTMTLRGAVGYDQTPVLNAYRNVQLPDNNRYIVALGGHYQATKTVGVDLGWTHLFTGQASVNPPPQITGAQTVVTSGQVTGGADVIGGQITWDIV